MGEFGPMGNHRRVWHACVIMQPCFGLMLYVRAIAVTVDSSTPPSLDIMTKFVLGMTLWRVS